MECNQVLSWFFVIVKYVMLSINIVCPILLMISLAKQFIVLIMKPDEKKEKSKIKNSIFALILVFFIPLMVNLVIFWVDDNYQISRCIENASYEGGDSQYIDINGDEEKKQSVIVDPSEYDSPIVSGRTKLARLAVAVAPTAEPDGHLIAPNADPWYKIDDSRLYDFYEVMDLTIKNYGENYAYGSCAQAAGGIIRATVDPDFDVSSSEASLQYLFDHPDKWKNVGIIKAGEKLDDKLEVGDVLSRGSHLMIYVGNDLARSKFPNTRGNVFQADYSEGNYAKYPSIDYIETDFRDFYIFRPTGTVDSPRPFISIDKYLDN